VSDDASAAAIERATRVLHVVARGMYLFLKGTVDYEDLVNYGYAGMLRVARADATSLRAFEAYARTVFKGEMLTALAKDRRDAVLMRVIVLNALNKDWGSDLAPGVLATEDGCQAELARRLREEYTAGGLAWVAGASGGDREASSNPEAQVARAQVQRMLRDRVRRLSTPRRRTIVDRHVWRDQSFEEIAEHLGISAATAWREFREALVELNGEEVRAVLTSDADPGAQ
jgi:RNA polymerase sigma factor (sigma-70 family)